MFKNIKIGPKLILGFLIIAFISIGVVASLSFVVSKNFLETEIFSKIKSTANVKEELLAQLIEVQIANIQYLAQEPAVVRLTKKMVNFDSTSTSQDQAEAKKELKQILINFGDFYGGSGLAGGTYTDIMVADLYGYLWIGTYGPDEGGNEYNTEWFSKGKKNIYLGDISYNPTMHQTTQIAAIPIADENNQVIAVLQLETNIRTINALMAKESESINKTEKVYIVNSKKFKLTSDQIESGSGTAQEQLAVNTQGVNAILSGQKEILSKYLNYKNVPVFGFVHRFSVHADRGKQALNKSNNQAEKLIADLGWLIVAEVDQAEAEAPVADLRNKIILAGLFVLILAVILGFFISRSISRPIKQLTEISKKINEGDLDQRATVGATDEIGILAQNFNQMTDSLLETQKLPNNIIRSMAESLIMMSSEGKIKEVNQVTLDLLGYKKKELVGQFIEKIFKTASFFGGIKAEKLFENGSIKNIDTNYQTQSGEQIPVNISGSVIKNEKGKVVGIVIIAKDMREIQKLQREKLEILENSKKELEQKIVERTVSLDLSNKDLTETNQKMELSNQQLSVAQKELENKISELERFNNVTMGREIRILELKEEIDYLKKKCGEV